MNKKLLQYTDDIEILYMIFKRCSGISIDSRKIDKDNIYFALKGERFNGNHYAAAAIKNGTAYAVVDEIEFVKDERYIYVENTLSALQDIARHHRSQFAIPVIGIAGTNGKTTTKELLNAILSTQYVVVATQGN